LGLASIIEKAVEHLRTPLPLAGEGLREMGQFFKKYGQPVI
jgi:hypothetical protein